MHELSIALNLLQLAEEEADRNGAGEVAALHLRIGPLSGVDKDALLSAWELAREQTRFQSTAMLIEDAPVIGYCPVCDQEGPIVSIQRVRCATCGAPPTEIVSGRELDLIALEVES